MGAYLSLSALGGVSRPDISPPLAVGTDIPSTEAAGFQANALDMLIPGFSVFSAAVHRYLHIDLSVYIPLLVTLAAVVFGWQYLSDWVWAKMDTYLMSKCSLRTDDEAYNYVMAWVAKQHFSQRSRRFIVNTNTNSRAYFLWNWNEDQDKDRDEDETGSSNSDMTRKPLSYTPDYGSHYFFYKGTLLCFLRSQGRETPYSLPSEKEEIYISCFGRNPAILKDLLNEARDIYLMRDEKKTAIYRGTVTKGASSEPTWSRCMARTSRPFSTVILNEKVKQDLIDDVRDYLEPATRRWYSNRGIPYRRGYLLHGPPGTGKSSLSLALAGFFKMRIYIVSLSSVNANEETLATLFSELPRRCVVLLEDIDSAGLTHTREGPASTVEAPAAAADERAPGQLTPGLPVTTTTNSRISLSGLLNILDGVASQEGRVLIMTTNHIEKLDKALIRPGRVDMIVHFGRADRDMVAAIFKAIYAPLEGDDDPEKKESAADEETRCAETLARLEALATQFADRIPAHEFSPAELQGYLMKHKRDAEAAVAGAEGWVGLARTEKAEKEVEEAREKRRREEEEVAEKKKVEDEKRKEEAKKKRKEARKKSRAKRSKASGYDDNGSSGSDTAEPDEDEGDDGSDDSSEEEEEEEEETTRKTRGKNKTLRQRRKPAKKSKVQDETDSSEGHETADRNYNEAPKQQQQQPHLLPQATTVKLGKHQDNAKPPRSLIGGDSGYETC